MRSSAACLLVVVSAWAAAEAQAIQTPTQSQTTEKKPEKPQSDQPVGPRGGMPGITVTGCVERSGGDAVGAAGAAGSAAGSAGGFVLADAVTSSSTGTAGSSTTSGTAAGTTASSTRRERYVLTGGKDLGEHVGHRVEITGIVERSSSSPTSTSTSSSSSSSSISASRLKVESVRMVSSACSK
jgi:hypothetical protein